MAQEEKKNAVSGEMLTGARAPCMRCGVYARKLSQLLSLLQYFAPFARYRAAHKKTNFAIWAYSKKKSLPSGSRFRRRVVTRVQVRVFWVRILCQVCIGTVRSGRTSGTEACFADAAYNSRFLIENTVLSSDSESTQNLGSTGYLVRARIFGLRRSKVRWVSPTTVGHSRPQ